MSSSLTQIFDSVIDCNISNYLVYTVSFFLQSALCNTWLGYSVCPFSCSSSVLQWVLNKFQTVSNSCSAVLKPRSWKRVQLFLFGIPGGAWGLLSDCWGTGRWVASLQVCVRGRSVYKELPEEVSRLHSSTDENAAYQILSDTVQLGELKPITALKEMQAESAYRIRKVVS